MNNQEAGSRRQHLFTILSTHGVGLVHSLGSQKELGPALLRGEAVEGKPDSDLDLGAVLLAHPLLPEEENAHVRYAASRGIMAQAVNEESTCRYRRQALTLSGNWHSWPGDCHGKSNP
jgi:hypothetical protein